jgi:intracellular sulfur oxidation DsrE/DsrF family protein
MTSNLNIPNWQTPIIEGYGRIVLLKNAKVVPDKNATYKILFQVKSDGEKDGVNSVLWHIAREINLLGASNVSPENIQIIAVISGAATQIALSDMAYQKRNNKPNPNIDLIEKLYNYGVTFEICSQAVAEQNINPDTELNNKIILTLSALIDIPTYQMQGYTIMFN